MKDQHGVVADLLLFCGAWRSVGLGAEPLLRRSSVAGAEMLLLEVQAPSYCLYVVHGDLNSSRVEGRWELSRHAHGP